MLHWSAGMQDMKSTKKWGPEQERSGFYMYASDQNSLEARRPRFRRLGSVLPQQHQSHYLHHHYQEYCCYY